MPDYRLGDIIDDYCVKCKRIMNHAIVSMLNGEPAKVRCRTCHNDHDYRHEQAPPPKVDARKAALFDQVLSKMGPSAPADPEMAEEAEVDAEAEGEPEAEAEAEPAPAPVKAAPKASAKPRKTKKASK